MYFLKKNKNINFKISRFKMDREYTYEDAMNANIKSVRMLGIIMRVIGEKYGVGRVGRSTVKFTWDNITSQYRPHSEIKQVIEIAAKIARECGKKTISINNIKTANDIVLNTLY